MRENGKIRCFRRVERTIPTGRRKLLVALQIVGQAVVIAPKRRLPVKELVRYLLENLYLDFQGEISLDTVRQFLRGDDSREAKALLQKLIEDKGVDDLLITLADVLKEHIRTGVTDQVMREQLSMYSES
jgi:hypothetical protein